MCTHTPLHCSILCICTVVYVFIGSFIKINSEEVFEVSLYAKQKADGEKNLFFIYINTVESLHI